MNATQLRIMLFDVCINDPKLRTSLDTGDLKRIQDLAIATAERYGMLEPVESDSDVPKSGPGSNTGHGHVWERPDGMKARCAGVNRCDGCRLDAAIYS